MGRPGCSIVSVQKASTQTSFDKRLGKNYSKTIWPIVHDAFCQSPGTKPTPSTLIHVWPFCQRLGSSFVKTFPHILQHIRKLFCQKLSTHFWAQKTFLSKVFYLAELLDPALLAIWFNSLVSSFISFS